MNAWPSRAGGVGHLAVIDVIAGVFAPFMPAGATLASAAWPTAKKVFYLPFRVPSALLVQQLYVYNGAAVSGNVDVGIYTPGGTRLVSIGSTAQAGTNDQQLFDIADTLLAPGAYYLAVTLDNTTGTTFRLVPLNVGVGRIVGALTETTVAFGLPATATFATVADTYYPACGLLARSAM